MNETTAQTTVKLSCTDSDSACFYDCNLDGEDGKYMLLMCDQSWFKKTGESWVPVSANESSLLTEAAHKDWMDGLGLDRDAPSE